MSLLEELKDLGVDVDEGLDRVMGDKALYEMMMRMFADSADNDSISSKDFSETNLTMLIKYIHMLKDFTGNLAITPLFKIYTQIQVLLRTHQVAEAREEYEKLLPVQTEIIDCIKRHKRMA